jgi:hypothetical protein
MTKQSLPGLMARKTLGTIIIWATVGLCSLQALFYVSFGPAI